MFYKIVIAIIISNLSFVCFSQLDLKEIMKGHEFVGYLPDYQRWSADGKSIYFEWNKDKEPGNSTYSYDLVTGKVQKVEEKVKEIAAQHHLFTKEIVGSPCGN